MGEGLAAVVLVMRTAEQAVSRVAETLAGYAVGVLFQRPIAAAPCHDTRLGRALDAWGGAGLDRLDGAVLSPAIQREAVDLARLHPAATSLPLSGADERGAGEEGPLVTVGDSRDHRPDLKPLLCGLTVTAEGIPGWGHVTEGHQRDSPAQRFHRTPLRQHRPDVGEPLLVADRQFFAGEPRALAAAHRLRLVTWVPQTVSLRPVGVEAPERRERPRLGAQPGRRHGEPAQ